MASFRFVHTADVHLDSPLRSLAMRNPQVAELVGNATRQAFVRIIDLCLDESVDALMIAGDLYDGDQTSMKTAKFLAAEIHRLDQAGGEAFLLKGNHDALSKITHELVFPPSVTVFKGRAEAIRARRAPQEKSVIVHGISFAQPKASESLLPKYKPPVEGALNIGMMHTSVGGSTEHDPYAPCTERELHDAGYLYWALGHVHKRWESKSGSSTIVMPGIPQGRYIDETGRKSVSLVTIEEDGTVLVEERVVSIAQFERVEISAHGIEEYNDLLVRLDAALGAARQKVEADHLIVRLSVTGATPLAWRLRRDSELFAAECEHRASLLGATWIEKVEIECQLPDTTRGRSDDPVSELAALIASEILPAQGFHIEMEGLVKELMKHLPAEMRQMFGDDPDSFAATVDRLASEGTEDVLARLQARGGDA